ncbi:helix-turn-helix transcriptional regulator [Pseudomonas sp. SWRI74]|uniref:Helix-turn-helix transcriptional regulator n=1 Tax=Pseudomonas azerbaijanoccidentalis TaxID=2842347 RepID=A0ABS6QZJ5_9PSED|nr:helix-turn-helix transcriptional regulator [Pseudomonas azerbaijanoccidentalis]MBV4524363.1 helix-turn-helix transcriptional regulator [Pseudomonas azerbaijanoccidentalis]
MTLDADRQPSPQNIRKARKNRNLSESAAGELIYVSRESWRLYEKGTTKMKLGLWELFLFKTGQLWIKPIVEVRPKSIRAGRVENLRPFGANTLGAD